MDPAVVSIIVADAQQSGAFVLSEADFFRSRDQVTVAQSGPLSNGTVLGQITATGKYVASSSTATDGSEIASAVLWEDIDATLSDVLASVISRDAEVLASSLAYDASVNTDTLKQQKWAQLAVSGIVVRLQDNPEARAANMMQQIYRQGA